MTSDSRPNHGQAIIFLKKMEQKSSSMKRRFSFCAGQPWILCRTHSVHPSKFSSRSHHSFTIVHVGDPLVPNTILANAHRKAFIFSTILIFVLLLKKFKF
jgi:hypothetical protein